MKTSTQHSVCLCSLNHFPLWTCLCVHVMRLIFRLLFDLRTHYCVLHFAFLILLNTHLICQIGRKAFLMTKQIILGIFRIHVIFSWFSFRSISVCFCVWQNKKDAALAKAMRWIRIQYFEPSVIGCYCFVQNNMYIGDNHCSPSFITHTHILFITWVNKTPASFQYSNVKKAFLAVHFFLIFFFYRFWMVLRK